MATEARIALLSLLLAGGCATREHLSPAVLGEVLRRDPDLARLRVYPSMEFIAYYDRSLGEQLRVDGPQGAVQTGYRGQRALLQFPRALPGAIVAIEQQAGVPLLWVTFDPGCHDKGCALGFVGSQDHVFRLHHVPSVVGFSAPRVYRRRVADRNLMQPSRIYARSQAAQVYVTTRGLTATISLEIKKRDSVDIQTVVVPQRGVDAP